MYILNTWSDGSHKFDVVDQLPEGAVADNYIELDGETFMIYAGPDVPAFGRSFAADLWGQYLVEHSEAFEELWDKLHAEGESDGR